MESKQGIILEEQRVLKIHPSIESAELERTIADLYSRNMHLPIRTPQYFTPEVVDNIISLPMERIKGRNLMYNTDQSITDTLVRDLALFHEIFSQSDKACDPNVLYRDAIASNYMQDDYGLIQIDFSSSNRFVHCFDDLALLLHPAWNKTTKEQRKRAVRSYIGHRNNFHGQGLRRILRITPFHLSGNGTEEKRCFYRDTIEKMEDTVPDCKNFKTELQRINFELLDENDFERFFQFRDFRARYYLKSWSLKR